MDAWMAGWMNVGWADGCLDTMIEKGDNKRMDERLDQNNNNTDNCLPLVISD